jgi:hypothetical protein
LKGHNPWQKKTTSAQSHPSNLAVFKGREIRKTIHNNEWWFSVVDVVAALTDSVNARDYWYKMKLREKDEVGVQLSTICRQLKLAAVDGKKYETDCANTEGIFRIIQSIPSPKAEPFKRWLAKVGYERVQEIEDPELAIKRTRELCITDRSISVMMLILVKNCGIKPGIFQAVFIRSSNREKRRVLFMKRSASAVRLLIFAYLRRGRGGVWGNIWITRLGRLVLVGPHPLTPSPEVRGGSGKSGMEKRSN